MLSVPGVQKCSQHPIKKKKKKKTVIQDNSNCNYNNTRSKVYYTDTYFYITLVTIIFNEGEIYIA